MEPETIPEPASGLPRGTLIGRYVIVSTVGRGGMGTVYAAYDPQLERRIAIKVLHAHLVSDDMRARFLREAQALARLSHPNVVTLHDVGTFGESVFLAMEYVAGQTLAKWLKAEPRSCPQVLDVLSRAGHGIAAAHAAGIIHRDVKPDNVLIADDGRVVVMDFGLARSELGEPEPAVPAPPPGVAQTSDTLAAHIASSDPVTLEGGLLGTVGFMSPEQAWSEPTDARTDQWSFCAMLYFALYGEPPIRERHLDEYVAAVDRAVIDPPPKSGVPSSVRRALRRGLAREPEERFESMEALLAELRPSGSQRLRAMIAAGGLVAVACAMAAVAWRPSQAAPPSCADPAPAIDGIWNPSVREDLRRAFDASGAKEARAMAERVSGVLDRYEENWIESDRQVCEATRVRHVASEEAMHVRFACLDRRRTELTSLVALLKHADAQIVDRSVEAAYGLRAPSSCETSDVRQSVDALPEDPAARAQVLDARRAIVDAESLIAAGKPREGLARADEALAMARAAKHRATEAEALIHVGEAQEMAGLYEGALDPYAHSIAAAEAASDDATVAEAAARLAFISGDKLLRPDEAAQWLDMAYGALERLGSDDAVRAKILVAHAPLPTAAGHPEESLPLFDELIPLAQRLYGEDNPKMERAYNNLGYAQQMLGHQADALEAHRHAMSIIERAMGPNAPTLAIDMSNIGSSLLGLGRYDEARAALERAIQLAGEADAQSFWIGWASQYVGLTALRTGDVAGALEASSRGLDIAARRGAPAARLLVGLDTVRGRALLMQGDREGALAACSRAVQALEARGTPAADRVLEWDPFACVGEALLAKGRAEDALPVLERAAALPRRVYAGDLAVARFALARALEASKRDPDRALDLARQASVELEAVGTRPREREQVVRWLSKTRE